ncbi:unnamed protein product [Periconia digitata]|uniref:SRR1-like domain-containing protein n=1 Tax=Periconia digitata TaxID=1303443 RepID=A0A9W4XN16_9PLEO|nr:unnamed protein product [Periconia digitata]
MSLAAVETPLHHFPTARKQKSRTNPKPKKSSSKGDQQLQSLFSDIQALYATSKLSQNLTKQITSTFTNPATTPIKTLLSLGLGSPTTPSKNQPRILKQLAIFLALSAALENAGHGFVTLYAQDPVFTRADESFLSSLGIKISRTSRGAELGEATALIDAATIVYSPFLTLEAYEALLLHAGKGSVRFLIGDDFEKLLAKWPKFSEERKQVLKLVRGAVGGYRRRGVGGDGFWEEGDGAFPMALYERGGAGSVKAKAKM